MKNYFYTVLLFFIFLQAGAQNAYYDALKLKTYLQPSGKFDTSKAAVKEYAAILKSYTLNNSADASTILELYRSHNPFMKEFIPPHGAAAGGNSMLMNRLVSSVSKTVGGMDVTNFADGMAKFLVARAKQELNTAFFEKFKGTLQANKDLQLLFPKTHSVLLVVGSEVYNFQIYLNVLREAFEYDLSTIIRNSRNFMDKSDQMKVFRDKAKVYAAVSLSFDLADALQAGQHPGEALSSLLSKKYLVTLDTNLYRAIQVYTIFSTSLRSYESDRYWISSEEFRKLENPTLFKIYLGLIYQSFPKDITFVVKKDTIEYRSEVLATFAENPADYFTIIKNIGNVFQQVELSVYALKQKGRQSTGMDYYSLYNNILTLIDVVYTDLNPDTTEKPPEYNRFKTYAQMTGEVYLNTVQRKYSMAIMNTVILLDSLTPDKALSASMLKYGSFMAAVVQAENSDQVKEAIEAVALPAGSARVKRESLWNISINAYLGGYGGAEYIQKLKQDNLKASTGLSAPIGIAFSRGSKLLRRDKTKAGWSYTAFLSFIDVGAIASFRIKDSTTAALPQLKLENILAPGVYLIAGIPKSPLSLGMFCQYGPSLRSVSASNTSVSSYNQTTWRIGGMLAVDIPLLNLYNKGR